MVISDLKKFYGEPYNNAYYEISTVLESYKFFRTQGSVYLSEVNDMSNLVVSGHYKATLTNQRIIL